jgi:predicted transcriptional regulator
MNLQERKEELIEKIRSINDEAIIEEMLYAILSLENDAEYIHLTPAQEQTVNESMAQYKRGEFITQEDLEKKIDKWLEE